MATAPKRKSAPVAESKPATPSVPVPSETNEVKTVRPTPKTRQQSQYTQHVPTKSIVSNENSIKDMQQALINLGKIMSKNYALKMDLSPQEREGVHPFGNFLVNQYINHGNTDSKQFVNTELKQPVREQSSIHDKELRGLQGLVDDLNKIGTPGVGKGERSPDGIWQSRTDHALNTALTIGNALLQLSKDMQVKIEGFSDKDITELSKLIPQKYTQLKNPSETAEQIIPYLNKIGVFYHSFEKAILNNNQYKSLITQEKPFASQNKIEKLDDNEQKILNNNSNIPNLYLKDGQPTLYHIKDNVELPPNFVPISLQNISDINSFKSFLDANHIKTNDQNVINHYISSIKNLLETGGVGY